MTQADTSLDLTPEHLEPPDGSIGLHLIKIGDDRGRKDFKHVLDLRDSIKKHGLINPITVSQREDGTYKLLAGESRLRAIVKIPWTKIPCYIKTGLSEIQEKEIELEENLRRTNLSWQEECELMEQIDTLKREQYGSSSQGKSSDADTPSEAWSLEKTAKLTNKSIGAASQQINFSKKLKARKDIAERVGHLPLTHAMKEYDRILEAERLERLHKGGELEISLDFRHGDAREEMKTQASDSIDLVIWDPPYGLEELENEKSDTKSGKMKTTDNMSFEAALNLNMEIISEVARVLKPGAHFYIFFSFSMYTDLCNELETNGLEFSPVPLIWDKAATSTVFKGYNHMSCYEPILHGYKPPRTKRLSEPCKNVLPFKGVPKKGKLHAFEKPVDLLAKLIKLSSNLGDTVLDPTAGSGATLDAAIQTGRKPIGFELDQEHFLRASMRLQLSQQALEEIKNA